ncbi:MAG: hypothetical protein O7E51_03635 [Acidobacteria bacterium]|nr:hypothetical protein [Acidobacteriota bacterium]
MVVKKSGQPRKTRPKQASTHPSEVRRTQAHWLAQDMEKLVGQHKAFQREPWYKELYRDHPIYSKLLSTYVVRKHRTLKFEIQRLGMNPDSELEHRESLGGKIKELDSEAKELDSWIGLHIRPLSEETLRPALNLMGDNLSKSGLSFVDIEAISREVRDRAARKPRGRPPIRRPLAVTALEIKLANPRLSWTDLARMLCPSGQANDFHWRESLRQEVMALKKVLRKYKIPY